MILWLLACSQGGTWVRSGDTSPEEGMPDSDSDAPMGTAHTGSPAPFVEQASTEVWSSTIALRTNLPREVGPCAAATGAPCEDLDGDGLADRWEALVLEGFVPLVRFDESEPLMDDPDGVFAAIGRVAPAGDHVRAFFMLGYHNDYGRCGVSGHPGDSERAVLDLEPLGDGDVGVVGAYTAAHENTGIGDHSTLIQGSELGELVFELHQGVLRWVVFASDGKHATYPTAQRCEDASFIPCVEEDCSPDGVVDPTTYERLPPVFNAGEEAAPLLTTLDSIGFPGEQAWLDQDFCGGLGGGLLCAGSIRSKLLEDPYP